MPTQAGLPRAAGCCLMFIVILGGNLPAQSVEGLANLRFQPDARVFAVLATLNLAGFDLDAENLKPDSVRAFVRSRLAGVSPELRERVAAFCRSRDTDKDPYQRQAKYVSFALLLTGPPRFALVSRPEELPPDAQSLQGLEPLVEELWRAGGMDKLWDEARPRYLGEIESYRPLMREMIVATLRYFHTEARVSLDRKMTFIPDLMNGFNVINARNISHEYIVVVGPSRGDNKPMRSVRHEYLHFLVDPLFAKYVGYLPDAEPFLERIRSQPSALERYQNNFYLMVTESFLQMAELRLDSPKPEAGTAALIGVYDQGLILAPYFEEELKKFEAGSTPLASVFRNLIEGIRWDVESKRAAAIEELRRTIMPDRQGQESANDARAQTEADVRALLSEANQLLLSRDFDRAGELLERVLRLDGRNASALFGLAQVAAQRQYLDRALELNGLAAANAGSETWIAAWALVHRGSIFLHKEEVESARAEWKKVLDLKGDLRGAKEAATKALEALIK